MAYNPIAEPDATAFTAGSSPILVPGSAVFNDTLAALTSGQAGAGRQTPNRARHVNLRAQAGTELATAAAPLRVDPTGTTKQPITLFDGSGNAIASTSSALDENFKLLGGAAVDVNSGNKSAGTQRVVLATDQPALTNGYSQITTSGDAITRQFVSSRLASLVTTLTTTNTTLLTGGPNYYITSVNVQIDSIMFFPGGGTIVLILSDSTDGTLFQWFISLPAAAGAVTIATNVSVVTPPGWFFKSSTSSSTLRIKVASLPTNNTFAINVAYGFTSL